MHPVERHQVRQSTYWASTAEQVNHSGQAALPATCGELVQGTLDGIPCLVSCPIARYSLVEVQLRPEPGWEVPVDVPKSGAALQAGLSYLGLPWYGGTLSITSDLPRGRGYGSSTADVGAALFALGRAAGRPLAPHKVARLAVNVEPSDSTPFPGLALFAHRTGCFYEILGPAPRLAVITIDPGGEVDSLAFNRLDFREALARLAPEHRQAFDLLRQGLRRGEAGAVGEAATLSARLHEAILPSPLLEQVLAAAAEVHAMGVCRAHSGTLSGLLLDPDQSDVQATLKFVARRLPARVNLSIYSLVGGGPTDEY